MPSDHSNLDKNDLWSDSIALEIIFALEVQLNPHMTRLKRSRTVFSASDCNLKSSDQSHLHPPSDQSALEFTSDLLAIKMVSDHTILRSRFLWLDYPVLDVVAENLLRAMYLCYISANNAWIYQSLYNLDLNFIFEQKI